MNADALHRPAVVCDDRAAVRHIVASLLARHGFAVSTAADLGELERTARCILPAVAVVGLPVAGASGMQAVRRVLAAAPACAVLVLSPFATLDLPAVEAGAAALLDEHDVVGLERALRAAFPDVPVPRPSDGPPAQPALASASASTSTSASASAVSGRVSTKPST